MKSKKENNSSDSICGLKMERFIQPCILLLLKEKKTHGYELLEDLIIFGFEDNLDPGMVYRNLRKLEEEGAISSKWDTGKSGPARRVYTLTSSGEKLIHGWTEHIQKKIKRLEYFLERYNNNFEKEVRTDV